MKKTTKINQRLIALLFVLVAMIGMVRAQGGSCTSPVIITPTVTPNLQTYNLGGNSIWVKFTGSFARIDVIEAFHSDINQKIQQIEVYSNCTTLTQTVSLVGAGFLQRHLIVYSTDLVRIIWTLPSTPVNFIFQLVPSTPNACMPVPDKFAQSSINYTSILFPGNDFNTPYTGKILVAAHTTLYIDKHISFENCEFVMEYGSVIQLGQGIGTGDSLSLYLKNCHIHGCDLMWEGIRSNVSSILYMDNVMLEDAYRGVTEIGYISKGARFEIINSIFNNNLIGAEIGLLFGNPELIKNTIFTSRKILTTPSYFPSVNQLKANSEALLLGSVNSALKPPMASISRSYCGIFGQQHLGLGIEGGPTAAEYNLFDRMAFGIISFMSRARITNCHFQNMDYAVGKPPFSMDYIPSSGLYNSPTLLYQGVGIAADGISASDYSLQVGNGQPLKSCLFKNCASAGISINALREKRILLNQFICDANIPTQAGGNYGIKIMNENFTLAQPNYTMTTHIISNHITNAKHAIASYQAGVSYNFSDLKIYYNTIDGIPGTGIELAATNTDFYPGPSAYNYPLDKTIFQNSILNTQTGIKITNVRVVPGATNTHLYVNYNSITLSPLKTATTASIGVNLISCQNIDVVNNVEVSSTYSLTTEATPASAPFHAAFKNINSPNCIVSCNTAHNVEQGYVFEGTCLPTTFSNNYMSKCYDGLTLGFSGIIGVQGSEPHPSDNYWNPNSGSFGHKETYAENSNGLASPFFVRNLTGYLPTINASLNGANIPFQNSTGQFFQCSTINNKLFLNEYGVFEKLAKDSIYLDSPPEMNYLKDKLIFDKMEYDSIFSDTSSQELKDYYEILKIKNVGKLGESEKLLKEKDYLMAKLLASIIVSQNTAEEIAKQFTISYCNWLIDSLYNFSQNEIEQLQLIASMCPAIYGDAVTMARTLLKIAIGDYFEYEENCNENSARKSQIHETKNMNITNSQEVILSPNPANEYVVLTLGSQNSLFKLMDFQGRIIVKKELNEYSNIIELAGLENGIYVYEILTSSHKIIRDKLIIAK